MRVTAQMVNDAIGSLHYFTAADGVFGARVVSDKVSQVRTGDYPSTALNILTFCVAILKNGFTVVGKSVCVDPLEYDRGAGQRYAHNDAIQQISEFLAFGMKDKKEELIKAIPMSKCVYYDYRGWLMPEHQQEAEGYLLQYPDGSVTWVHKNPCERDEQASVAEASASEPTSNESAATSSASTQKTELIYKLEAEYQDLWQKLVRLDEFLATVTIDKITQFHYALLEAQRFHMNEYMGLLHMRMVDLQK